MFIALPIYALDPASGGRACPLSVLPLIFFPLSSLHPGIFNFSLRQSEVIQLTEDEFPKRVSAA